jgi:uncharacterized protein YutE (UPF0331/DUF86 family)
LDQTDKAKIIPHLEYLEAVRGEEVPETSREILFKIGAEIYRTEKEAEEFSELAKIRNTLAHRYLDIKWNDIKRFYQIGARLYPPFIEYIRNQINF